MTDASDKRLLAWLKKLKQARAGRSHGPLSGRGENQGPGWSPMHRDANARCNFNSGAKTAKLLTEVRKQGKVIQNRGR
jgi:hypothetical protein